MTMTKIEELLRNQLGAMLLQILQLQAEIEQLKAEKAKADGTGS